MKIRRPNSDANPQVERETRPRRGGGRRGRLILPALVLLLLLGPTRPETVEPPAGADVSAETFLPDLPPPVLLVPGWLDGGTDLEPLRQRLIEAGWEEDRVQALHFDDPVGSNIEHAEEVAHAVAELMARTGASQVDFVAHSMGGLAVRHYMLFLSGGEFARSVIFLGTPHRGTLAAHVAWGTGGEEMVPGSDFLTALNERGTVPDGVRVRTIRTPIDLRVLPMSSATLPGAQDVEVCCPSHAGLIYDADTFEVIRAFLADG